MNTFALYRSYIFKTIVIAAGASLLDDDIINRLAAFVQLDNGPDRHVPQSLYCHTLSPLSHPKSTSMRLYMLFGLRWATGISSVIRKKPPPAFSTMLRSRAAASSAVMKASAW